MKTSVVYVFPNLQPKIFEPMAKRFVAQYIENPPGTIDHTLHVIVNGGARLTQHQKDLFSPLIPEFFYHDNSGKDIGGFQMFSKATDADFMFCIGAPGRPRTPFWLDMFVEVFENHGPGIYGPWGFSVPQPHIRTTIFGISPHVLNAYPKMIGNGHRYSFEHGNDSITNFCTRHGLATLQVTLRGVFGLDNFHPVKLEDSIFCDQHTDRI